MNKDDAKKPVKLVHVTEEGRNPQWKSKKRGMIAIKEMDNAYLQKALLYAQSREWYFWKKMIMFTDKIKELDAEAERRGIKLKDLNEFETKGPKSKRLDTYWNRTRQLQKKTKELIKS